MRLNFACPRTLLEEGLSRLCKAVNEAYCTAEVEA
jgi:bifunctional pyridoxal-dependent enzyme with beta-cystathionase and maltose regulon repressor activities